MPVLRGEEAGRRGGVAGERPDRRHRWQGCPGSDRSTGRFRACRRRARRSRARRRRTRASAPPRAASARSRRRTRRRDAGPAPGGIVSVPASVAPGAGMRTSYWRTSSRAPRSAARPERTGGAVDRNGARREAEAREARDLDLRRAEEAEARVGARAAACQGDGRLRRALRRRAGQARPPSAAVTNSIGFGRPGAAKRSVPFDALTRDLRCATWPGPSVTVACRRQDAARSRTARRPRT